MAKGPILILATVSTSKETKANMWCKITVAEGFEGATRRELPIEELHRRDTALNCWKLPATTRSKMRQTYRHEIITYDFNFVSY